MTFKRIENNRSSVSVFTKMKVIPKTGTISPTREVGNFRFRKTRNDEAAIQQHNAYLKCWNIAKEVGKFFSIHRCRCHNEFHISSTRNYLSV